MKPTITLYALFILFGLSAYAAESTNSKKRKDPDDTTSTTAITRQTKRLTLTSQATPTEFYEKRMRYLKNLEERVVTILNEATPLPGVVVQIIIAMLPNAFHLIQRLPHDKRPSLGSLCLLQLNAFHGWCAIHSEAKPELTTYGIRSGNEDSTCTDLPTIKRFLTCAMKNTLSSRKGPYHTFQTKFPNCGLIGITDVNDPNPLRVYDPTDPTINLLKIEPETLEKIQKIAQIVREERSKPDRLEERTCCIPHISSIYLDDSEDAVAVYIPAPSQELSAHKYLGDIEIYKLGLDVTQ